MIDRARPSRFDDGGMPNPSVVLATAGYDHTVRFWEATRGICYRTLQYADSQVNKLEITPDKQYLAAAGNPHVRLYEGARVHRARLARQTLVHRAPAVVALRPPRWATPSRRRPFRSRFRHFTRETPSSDRRDASSRRSSILPLDA